MATSPSWRRYRNWLILPAFFALLYFGGCFGRSWYYTYEMVITVDTPEGPKVGRAVRRVRYWESPDLVSAHRTQISGDSVIVDLGPRGKLIALLSGPGLDGPWNAQDVFQNALPPRVGHVPNKDLASAWSDGASVVAEVKCPPPAAASERVNSSGVEDNFDNCPPMMTFRNLADPASGIMIEPAALDDAFGDGVKLRSIKVALTHDHVTHEIKQVLPWVGKTPEDKPFLEHVPSLSQSELKYLFVRNITLNEVWL